MPPESFKILKRIVSKFLNFDYVTNQYLYKQLRTVRNGLHVQMQRNSWIFSQTVYADLVQFFGAVRLLFPSINHACAQVYSWGHMRHSICTHYEFTDTHFYSAQNSKILET